MANQMGESSAGRPAGTGKPVTSIGHPKSKAVKIWMKKELKLQQARFKKILKHMEDISPQRDKWIATFLETIQDRGTNIDGDIRRVVTPEEIPKKPTRKFRVTYEPRDLKGIHH